MRGHPAAEVDGDLLSGRHGSAVLEAHGTQTQGGQLGRVAPEVVAVEGAHAPDAIDARLPERPVVPAGGDGGW